MIHMLVKLKKAALSGLLFFFYYRYEKSIAVRNGCWIPLYLLGAVGHQRTDTCLATTTVDRIPQPQAADTSSIAVKRTFDSWQTNFWKQAESADKCLQGSTYIPIRASEDGLSKGHQHLTLPCSRSLDRTLLASLSLGRKNRQGRTARKASTDILRKPSSA